MTSQPGKQTLISRSKCNQAMKFGRLMVYQKHFSKKIVQKM